MAANRMYVAAHDPVDYPCRTGVEKPRGRAFRPRDNVARWPDLAARCVINPVVLDMFGKARGE